MTKPHRAYRLSMKIEADTKEDLLHEIDHLHQRIAMDDITTGVYGGSSSGAVYQLLVDSDMTHDLYFSELNKYLENI